VKAVITGASGVVGNAVLRHLLDSGAVVRALLRPGRALSKEAAAQVEAIPGDILIPDSLRGAFAGADVVFHVAGVNQMCLPDPASMYRANVDGTRNVIHAARVAGVPRVVYTSSAATIGEPSGETGHEDSVHRGRYLSHYERSKHQAEEVAMTAAEGIEVVIVNPSSVQGPGRSTGTGKLLLDLVNGRIGSVFDTRFSIVDIDDCARGHLLAAERGRDRRRYLLNSFTLEMREAIKLLEQVVGRRIPVRMLPPWLAVGAATGVGVIYRLLGRKAPVCGEMVRTLLHGHAYDGSRATRELGLIYSTPDATLRRFVEWASAQGLLQRRV
jgi:dihydroflavonol-4-reductase